MIGLAHRGFELADSGHLIVHTLREAGYDHVADIEDHRVDGLDRLLAGRNPAAC
jgi:hypothetical protein